MIRVDSISLHSYAEADAINDYFVMNKNDYLLSIEKTADNDDDDAEPEWIGVKNQTDQSSVDEWAKDIGQVYRILSVHTSNLLHVLILFLCC